MAEIKLDVRTLARDFEEAGARHGWAIAHLSAVGDYPRPWLHLPGQRDQAARVYVSAGIHGDEPAPPLALLCLVRQPGIFQGLDVTLFPILNPEGLAVGIRGNRFNLDCNRDYMELKSAEVRGHMEVLQTLGRFDAAICLHEDWEAQGAYLYELHGEQDPDLSQPMLNAMAQHLPVELASVIDESEARNGIIRKKPDAFKDRTDWPEALYLTHRHTTACYTLETPSTRSMEHRIAAHMEAIRTACGMLADLPHRPE